MWQMNKEIKGCFSFVFISLNMKYKTNIMQIRPICKSVCVELSPPRVCTEYVVAQWHALSPDFDTLQLI